MENKVPFHQKVLKYYITPVNLPIIAFLVVIIIGTLLLKTPWASTDNTISWIDALFTATSATCVTGLTVLTTATDFSLFGQSVILILIQLGGLGIMTYTSVVMYLWRHQVSLSDHLIVGRRLLHDPRFKLGRFLLQIVLVVFILELLGALAFWLINPEDFHPFSAIFHSVSAFCNAGFTLQETSLIFMQKNILSNLIFMFLIVCGSIGFIVLIECFHWLNSILTLNNKKFCFSWYSKIVLETTLFLIIVGALFIFFSELLGGHSPHKPSVIALFSFFQSITTRTAGFNTVDISTLTNVSLVTIMLLMIIGGSPGSCGGGMKTTTFRTLVAFIYSQLRGRPQTVIHNYAVEKSQLNKALTLAIMYFFVIAASGLVLTISEGGNAPHPEVRGFFIVIMFEVISAFGTVGLSMGLTEQLTPFGKIFITLLMFVGRLGPIIFLATLQSWHSKPHYKWIEKNILIG